ncbi:MAG: hypothetical protein ACTSU5_17160 [Promethearchaeota archaeon]
MEKTAEKPRHLSSPLARENLACSIATGFIFSLSIFFGFVAFSLIPVSRLGNQDLASALLSFIVALGYLLVIPLDRRSKRVWLKVVVPAVPVAFGGMVLAVLTGSVVWWGLVLGVLVPAVFVSTSTLSFQGYFLEVGSRNASNASNALAMRNRRVLVHNNGAKIPIPKAYVDDELIDPRKRYVVCLIPEEDSD